MLTVLRAALRRPRPDEDALDPLAGRRDWARKRAIGAEHDAITRPCPQCPAGRWELCLSPTGLAASAPCPQRLREEASP